MYLHLENIVKLNIFCISIMLNTSCEIKERHCWTRDIVSIINPLDCSESFLLSHFFCTVSIPGLLGLYIRERRLQWSGGPPELLVSMEIIISLDYECLAIEFHYLKSCMTLYLFCLQSNKLKVIGCIGGVPVRGQKVNRSFSFISCNLLVLTKKAEEDLLRSRRR